MTQKELNKKVQLLKAGQIVQINGDYFRATQVDEWDKKSCCEVCDLDSICRGDVFKVCVEMEAFGSYHWILHLAHG